MKNEHHNDKHMNGETKSFLSFKLGEENFTIPVMKIMEILEVPKITRVPQSPNFLKFRLFRTTVLRLRISFVLSEHNLHY